MDEEEKQTANQTLSPIDNKFERFIGVFNSMLTSLNSQSVILQDMLKIQEESLKIQKDTKETFERTELLNKVAVDDKKKTEKEPKAGGPIQGMKDLYQDNKGLFSMGNLLKVGALAFLAPVIGEFIKDFVVQSFENMGIDSSLTTAFGEALGAAGMWGAIGSVFGKRIAGLFAVAGFIEDLFNLSEIVTWIGDTIGLELENGNVANLIGMAIAAAMIKFLPGIIGKQFGKIFSKVNIPGSVVTDVASGIDADVDRRNRRGRGGRGRGGLLSRLFGAADDVADAATPARPGAAPRVTAPAAANTPSAPRIGAPVAANTPTAPIRAPAVTPSAAPSTLGRIGQSVSRVGGTALRALGPAASVAMGLYQAGSALTDDTLTTNQKTQEVAGAAGGTGGALAGAAAGAAIGSVIPVVGTAIGGIIGGAIGYFGGDYLGRAIIGEAGYDQETVNRLASTNPSTLGEEERTRYMTELQEQYKAAVGIERDLMNSDKSQTPDYEHIQKQIATLNNLLANSGINPADVANKQEGYVSPNSGVEFTETYAFKNGTNGFQDFGKGSGATLHGSEAVIPENTMAGSFLKAIFPMGWNLPDISGISSMVNKGIEYVNNQGAAFAEMNTKAASPIVAPITNNYYQGGSSTNSSSTVVIGSTGTDLDKPGYAR